MLLIAIGASLLLLPVSQAPGKGLTVTEAIFTATSAVCVTGLTVVDTGSHFSTFGQLVLLFLFQAGGLGVMVWSTGALCLLGTRLGLQRRVNLAAQVPGLTMSEVGSLAGRITVFVLACEAVGALFLWLSWIGELGPSKALYFGVFHSTSAFCNAGFSLWPHGLTADVGNWPVNLTVIGLVTMGSFGYLASKELLYAAFSSASRRRLSLHTRLVLVVTLGLTLLGMLALLFFEYSNSKTLASLNGSERVLAALFQSVSRTSGFNTIAIGEMRAESLLLLIFLMFVGGSPGSTAGGIKTTTFAILLLTAWSQIRNRDDVEAFGRRIPTGRITQAVALTVVAMSTVLALGVIVNSLEPFTFDRVLFEVMSAAATVGLSTGITPELGELSRLVLCLAMFVGRVGPLTLGLALMRENRPAEIRYPRGEVTIG